MEDELKIWDCCYTCRKSCKSKRVKECSAKDFSTAIAAEFFKMGIYFIPHNDLN